MTTPRPMLEPDRAAVVEALAQLLVEAVLADLEGEQQAATSATCEDGRQ